MYLVAEITFWTLSSIDNDAKYKIVEFDEGIEMIPITWLNRDRTITYWPPQNQIKINKAISSMEPPKEN